MALSSKMAEPVLPEPARAATVRTVAGGVTAPAGFRAGAAACGIKRQRPGAERPLDLALVVADETASAAAVFTTNKAVAAPVVVSRAPLREPVGRARVIVTNSGCANACAGEAGLDTARQMAAAAAAAVGCPVDEALVASTGVIGVALDIARVRAGIADAHAALGRDGAPAARAIMT